MLLEVTSFFEEFKKKIIKNVEKIEKVYLQSVNHSCLETLDSLRKVAEIEEISNFEIFKYERKADKIIQALKKIEIEQCLNVAIDKLRIVVDETKK